MNHFRVLRFHQYLLKSPEYGIVVSYHITSHASAVPTHAPEWTGRAPLLGEVTLLGFAGRRDYMQTFCKGSSFPRLMQTGARAWQEKQRQTFSPYSFPEPGTLAQWTTPISHPSSQQNSNRWLRTTGHQQQFIKLTMANDSLKYH